MKYHEFKHWVKKMIEKEHSYTCRAKGKMEFDSENCTKCKAKLKVIKEIKRIAE